MSYWEKQWEGERDQAWEYDPDGFDEEEDEDAYDEEEDEDD